MTRREHLLTILVEECAEVAQRATKALRFGLEEVQPGQEQSNAARLLGEWADILGVMSLLTENSSDLAHTLQEIRPQIEAKMLKIEKYLEYSKKCGTLQ